MSAAELLPCPFCGDTLVHLVERVYDGSHPELQRSKYCFVECVPNDHRTGSFYENDAEMMGIDKTMQQLAIEDWNRRVAPLASAPAGWMDIESAPRDGTEFVAANANQGFVKCLLNWDTIHGYWESKGKPMLHMQYTHWHALPEKPAPPEAGRMVTKEGGVGV